MNHASIERGTTLNEYRVWDRHLLAANSGIRRSRVFFANEKQEIA